MADAATDRDLARGPAVEAGREQATRAGERRAKPYIVLVALDLSEPGGRAWRFAFDLAELHGEDSEVHAVVLGPLGMAPSQRDVPTPRGGATSLAPNGPSRLPRLKVLERRSPGGLARLMAMHFRSGRSDRAILGLAREIGADLIVLATEPSTWFQRVLGGSVTGRLARSAPCPVVVVRPKKDQDDPGVIALEPRR